jgi:hypothetical protein
MSAAGARFALLRDGQAGRLLAEAKVTPAGGTAAVLAATCAEPISELQTCGFRLLDPEPDTHYSLRVGDVRPLGSGAHAGAVDFSAGVPFGDRLLWPDSPYFESARGRVRVRLMGRSAEGGAWHESAAIEVTVVPTKLGERRYHVMFEQMRGLSEGLVFDVLAKGRRPIGVELGRGGLSSRAGHLELRVLEALWQRLEPDLRAICAEPVRALQRRSVHAGWWGTGRLGPGAVRDLSQRGISAEVAASRLPIGLSRERLFESTDTPEHGIVAGFLELLLARAGEARLETTRRIEALQADREFLDIDLGEQRSLFDEVHGTRLDRLGAGITRADRLERDLRRYRAQPPFGTARVRRRPLLTPVFENVPAYRRVWHLMAAYLDSASVVLGQDASERVKDTWRLYEQWVFFQLAAAFRHAGTECGAVEGLLHQRSASRFDLDLQRGAAVSFDFPDGRRVRLRYEPWILDAADARRRDESVYRAGGGRVAWSPDVLIEVLRAGSSRRGEVEYAAVVDAKYSRRIGERHWDGVEKYLQIRATADDRPVTRQVWLAFPGDADDIRMRDAAVSWTPRGPDRPTDEHVLGTLALRPADGEGGAGFEPAPVALEFARGFLAYVGLPVGVRAATSERAEATAA